jgi:hypothetical protein
LPVDAKKETAKVKPPGKPLPQATVQLQKKPDASTPKSVSTAISVAPIEATSQADLSPILGIAALVIALASFGVQVMIFIG